MAEERVQRRLAAILAADVVGYSRLMGADEEGTLNALKSHREKIDKLIDQFNGQIVGSAGDSVLVEFYSPVEAVRCAHAIQVALRDMNAELPDHRRMEFRIGINLGDVIEDGKTIYGDGVNVAARLEGLAEPGGITVSGSIYDQVKNKLDSIFDDLGQHAVKNIAEPVKVYRLRVDSKDAPPRLGRAWASRLKSWHWVAIGVAAVLLFEGAAFGVWTLRQFLSEEEVAVASSVSSEVRASLELVPLPKKLSPGTEFQRCAACPEMVVVPDGRFKMGSPLDEGGRKGDEGPQHEVTIPRPFAMGKFELTFEQWDVCVQAGGCGHNPQDRNWGRGNRPVMYVSWNDAQEYVQWLSLLTGQKYRLPSEAEWEFAARAGSETPYWWGSDIGVERANCEGCGGIDGTETVPIGSFAANAFGLYGVHGNLFEWVADCWNGSYAGAPKDGSAWLTGNCDTRVLRGGSWGKGPEYLRAARRINDEPNLRSGKRGIRLAMTLP